MDLSKTAKKKRDLVEDPLWRLEKLLDRLEQVHTRMSAAVRVWPEIGRTLNPALRSLEAVRNDLQALKNALALVWREGFEMKWK